MEDPLAPARGIIVGLLLSIPFWIAVAAVVIVWVFGR